VQDFKKLSVRKKGHDLTLAVYSSTEGFPSGETYDLRNQMRKASTSIGINIAEGCGRSGQLELRRLLRMSTGSTSDHERLSDQVIEIRKMTTALIRKLRTEN
jgi:hypothetical protein